MYTHTHTTHAHRHHFPFRLSFRIGSFGCSSSVVDALYYIRCTHLTTGGVFQMPSWDLGLSPCHFLTRKVEVRHTHTHTHTHTHKCKQVSCNTHLHLPKCYVHTNSNCTCTDTHTHTHMHTHRHHSPSRLSSRIVWMNSSVVDTLYCIRRTHLMTGGVWSVPDAQLGSGTLSLSFPCMKC